MNVSQAGALAALIQSAKRLKECPHGCVECPSKIRFQTLMVAVVIAEQVLGDDMQAAINSVLESS